mmetsp:Transcript_7428/g.20625  ORF Transcript_7428/g.20625 Transcript_7428/m.20625 type:complete len:207 (-) Transcript_7428:168-788(-)
MATRTVLAITATDIIIVHGDESIRDGAHLVIVVVACVGIGSSLLSQKLVLVLVLVLVLLIVAVVVSVVRGIITISPITRLLLSQQRHIAHVEGILPFILGIPHVLVIGKLPRGRRRIAVGVGAHRYRGRRRRRFPLILHSTRPAILRLHGWFRHLSTLALSRSQPKEIKDLYVVVIAIVSRTCWRRGCAVFFFWPWRVECCCWGIE